MIVMVSGVDVAAATMNARLQFFLIFTYPLLALTSCMIWRSSSTLTSLTSLRSCKILSVMTVDGIKDLYV